MWRVNRCVGTVPSFTQEPVVHARKAILLVAAGAMIALIPQFIAWQRNRVPRFNPAEAYDLLPDVAQQRNAFDQFCLLYTSDAADE